jgi:hypothetical protein
MRSKNLIFFYSSL